MHYYMTKRYLMIRAIPLGLLTILDGLFMVLTLGNCRSLAFEFVAWDTKRWLEKRINVTKYYA